MSGDYSTKINLEGWVNFRSSSDTVARSYVQVYRNGILEALQLLDLNPNVPSSPGGIFTDYETKLSAAVPSYVHTLKGLEIEPPLILSLALVDVKGFYLLGERFSVTTLPFDRPDIIVPETMVTEPGFNTDQALLPLINMLWQAVGVPKSPRDNVTAIKPL
jgi:hypothetical protein